MDGRTSTESGPGAFDAALAFIEGNLSPLRRVEAAGFEDFRRVMDDCAALVTDQAHQALGKNAVQGGNKVVRLDSHVQEAADDVDHVVGVDGCKYQVSGQCRLDGDLGCFRVADFADHDFVGVVTQDGAQTAGEGQSLLFVDRDLGDGADLVFNRVFDGDDLVFVGLD